MTKIEKKAREIVRLAFFDYLESLELKEGGEASGYWFREYQCRLEMLALIFPDSTSPEALERCWYAKYKREKK